MGACRWHVMFMFRKCIFRQSTSRMQTCSVRQVSEQSHCSHKIFWSNNRKTETANCNKLQLANNANRGALKTTTPANVFTYVQKIRLRLQHSFPAQICIYQQATTWKNMKKPQCPTPWTVLFLGFVTIWLRCFMPFGKCSDGGWHRLGQVYGIKLNRQCSRGLNVCKQLKNAN